MRLSSRQKNVNFNDRIRQLIDEHFEGNVSEAARKLRVSQRGLAKVHRGDVTNPGLTFVLAVIRGFPQEDPMWIVTGIPAPTTRELVASAVVERALAIVDHAAADVEGTADRRSRPSPAGRRRMDTPAQSNQSKRRADQPASRRIANSR